VLTALGIAGGQTIWAVATSIGIVTLLVASAPLFLAVKYAVRPRRESRLTPLAAFRQGLISDLGNPKMAIFFASLLPSSCPQAKRPSQRSCVSAPSSQS
jgi:threonine/homoserine/homoserine lactone efflux protein